jgi:hypothetical protein
VPRRTLLAILTAAAVAVGGTAYAGAPGPSPKPHDHERTIRLVESSASPSPVFTDLGKPGPSVGDQVVVTDGLELEDGTAAGRLVQVCTLVEPGPSPVAGTFECYGSIALAGGTLTIAGPFAPAKADQAQAVTGGTGAFRLARGEASVRAEADQIIVRLAG